MGRSELLYGRAPSAERASGNVPSAPSLPTPPPDGGVARNGTLTVIAGVGVLLLAMGVGVLIGRSGSASGKQGAPAPQVITVSTPSSGGAAATTSETSFSSDWPVGTSGYTVLLQTLPATGTALSAVEAAKAAAVAKGAKGVGALKSDEFTSLSAGSYMIYAGIDHTRAAAEKMLQSLKKSFPAAKVVRVANGSSSSSAGGSGSSAASKVGSSESHPAPPSVLEGLRNAKGKSYEEKSKNLPDVVSTG
ncbi:MAG: hypothetical protein ACYDHN_01060 [Solirubrobacteraceae bacterium]